MDPALDSAASSAASSTRTVARVAWSDLAPSLRARLEHELGATVVDWVSVEEGFSPGLASRCRLADGRWVFVKALSIELMELSGAFFRHEVRVNRVLPGDAPAPEMLAVVDGDHGMAAAFACIDGRLPATPWGGDELGRVVAAVDGLDLAPGPELPSFADHLADDFIGWRELARRGETGIEPWLDADGLDRVAEVEAGWMAHCPPSALIHCDIRADNLLIDLVGDVWIVDWANACNGPPWVDLVGLIPSVTMQGGPPPAEIWARSRYAADADPAAVDAVVTALAGYFTAEARRPPVPQIPMLRAFQEAQAIPARAWMAQRLGLASTPR